ncbi:hypothetical protein I7I53_10124 [Histoplasma capsulatum var. duboisii H88]|uniref:Rhodopsin domain-containing protein n=1 Tax=Ajellomyces capsulatus (strain H88) TaxID=544711 RepID=A0A8A1LA70_AJEC8|nr:hypothetical protein I7I53_10124 [Histoplasma capsulatum var. duboisii H88]
MTDDSQQRAELGVVLALPVIAGFSLGLRLFGRKVSRYSFGWDDYLIIMAMVFSIVHCVVCWYYVKTNYVGIPFADVPPMDKRLLADLQVARKWAFANQVIYTVCLPTVKASTLIFMSRLEPGSKHVVRYLWSVFGLNLAILVIAELVIIFQCKPIKLAWSVPAPGMNFSCIDYGVFFLWGTITTIVTDFLVLAVPCLITYKLQLKRRRKIAVMVLLGLGVIVTIVSFWRLVQFIQTVYTGVDPSKPIGNFGFSASSLEVNIAIICACGPGIKPVLKRYVPFILGTSTSDTRTHTYGNTGYATHGTQLKSHIEDDGMFEMGAEARHQIDVQGGSTNLTQTDKFGLGPSISDSDEDRIMDKTGIVRTTDVSINYHNERIRNSPRPSDRDGKTSSVDSLV